MSPEDEKFCCKQRDKCLPAFDSVPEGPTIPFRLLECDPLSDPTDSSPIETTPCRGCRNTHE